MMGLEHQVETLKRESFVVAGKLDVKVEDMAFDNYKQEVKQKNEEFATKVMHKQLNAKVEGKAEWMDLNDTNIALNKANDKIAQHEETLKDLQNGFSTFQ